MIISAASIAASMLRIPMRGYEIDGVVYLVAAGPVTNPHEGL